jgi:tetratricopeptide (TPR) repeat protein
MRNQLASIFSAMLLGVLLAVLAPASWSQRGLTAPVTAVITVHVQEPGGGQLSVPAQVRLISPNNPMGLVQMSGIGGATTFNVTVGDYELEVTAAGFRLGRQDVSALTAGSVTHAYVMMRRDDGSGSSAKASDKPRVPELQGKSRKELDQAVASLRDNKAADAQKHVDYALKHSANNPDVQYVAALCAMSGNDSARAQQYLEAAVSLFPEHFAAQTALGGLLLQQDKADDAIIHFQKALAAEPNAWRTHRLLAEAYLKANHDLDKAKFHAGRALEFGKEKAIGAEITLAWAEGASGDRESGRARLERFLRENAASPDASRARALLASSLFMPRSEAMPRPVSAVATAPPANLLADVPPGPIRHLPSAVDAVVPAVDPGVSCALPQVLEGAALRASDFTDALQRFTATETFLHDELDANGAVRKTYNDSFQYLATLKWPRTDLMILTEVRNGRISVSNLPVPFVTEGLPSIGLVFHPAHAPNFQFTCEGLGHWRGQPAWQVRFEQRSDRPAQIHDWAEKGQSYPAILKGRAWISTGGYHLLRVETDLVKPIPEVRLELHHMTIEYAPIKLASTGRELWLPSYAEVYSRFRGRFFRQQHDFGDFILFSVDSSDKIKNPPQ